MQVASHIASLLRVSDFVTLPGFGIIEGRYAPATIHPVQHLFQPPGKTISFKEERTSHDTALENFISQKENISAASAAGAIASFVEEIKTQLKQKDEFEMSDIGRFYYNVEKQLQFIPSGSTNFLTASYGLQHFIANPILRNQHSKVETRPIVDVRKKRRMVWFRF